MTDVTAKHRGPRVVKKGLADYLLPTVVHCDFAGRRDREEGVHVPVRDRRRVPAGEDARGDRPDARVHRDHEQAEVRRRLLDAVHIDRLNFGPMPTIQLNWLQPHEGNIVDFLFRARRSRRLSPPSGHRPRTH